MVLKKSDLLKIENTNNLTIKDLEKIIKKEEKQIEDKKIIINEKKKESETLNDVIFKLEKQIEEEEREIEQLGYGAIIQIKDGRGKIIKRKVGILRKKPKYKINYNHYVIPGDGFSIINEDIRDIKPYARYLTQNKKEIFRHKIITYIGLGIIILLYFSFQVKSNTKKILENINNNMGTNEKEEIIENNDSILEKEIKELIPEPVPEGKGAGKG